MHTTIKNTCYSCTTQSSLKNDESAYETYSRKTSQLVNNYCDCQKIKSSQEFSNLTEVIIKIDKVVGIVALSMWHCIDRDISEAITKVMGTATPFFNL